MLMGLRLSEGVPDARIRAVCGTGIDGAFEAPRLAALIENGFILRTADRLRATPAGRSRLDAVIAHLLG